MVIEADNEPDYLAIRRALAQGNAAVMVGAGFSLNADGGVNLATWNVLAEGLRRELEPSGASNANTPVLQLGEQYARVFSVPALEEFIKKHVPDEKVVPALVHQRLLELPWTDIFTTNYDTLLERAADEIVEPSHYTVICREDIPKSKIAGRRRIVKLHGSFPSQRPFIFTEEDYRKYPVNFAPFVNMVRQALLENIFCLVGFSGDDPNFLHWIGWVRDMLDEHALPIYFFVPILPPLGQRKLLEARKIIPVVLPQSAGTEQSDYKSRYLELFNLLAEPTEPLANEWGDLPHFTAPEFDFDPAKRYQRFLKSFCQLCELRTNYPGWIIAPHEARRKLSSTSQRIVDDLDDERIHGPLRNEASALVVAVVGLYVWQQQVLLQPVDDRVAWIALDSLKATVDFKIEHESADLKDALAKYDSKSQSAFTSSWLALGTALLDWSRQELEDSAFSEIAELLRAYAPNDTSVADNVSYQSALFHISKGETAAARRVLQGWTPASTDSYMHIRKGALLAEVNEVRAGQASCAEGIRRIRKAQKQSPGSASLLSREAWACMVTQNVTRAIDWLSLDNGEKDESADTALRRRISVIASKGYDATDIHRRVRSAADAEACPPKRPRYRSGSFDLGKSTTSIQLGMSSGLSDKVQGCYSWLNLTDRVSLVPRIGNVTFDADSYLQAAWWVRYFDSMKRMTTALFRSRSESVLKAVDDTLPPYKTGWYSRCEVARTTSALAQEICPRALAQIETYLSQEIVGDFAESVCRFQAEVLSRLILRVESQDIIFGILERFISLYSGDRLRSLPRVWEAMSNVLRRCFESLDEESQNKAAALVIKAPEHGLVAEMPFGQYWMPHFQLLNRGEERRAANKISESMLKVLMDEASSLLSRSDQGDAAKWQRLLWLALNFEIPRIARKAVGAAIWRRSGGWPIVPGFLASVPLRFPAPDGRSVMSRFKSWLFQSGIKCMLQPATPNEFLNSPHRSWGQADNTFFDYADRIVNEGAWRASDSKHAATAVLAWWNQEGEELVRVMDRLGETKASVIRRFQLIDQLFGALAFQKDAHQSIISSSMFTHAMAMGAKMWLLRLSLATAIGAAQDEETIELEIAETLMSTRDESVLSYIFEVVVWWAKRGHKVGLHEPAKVLDSLFILFSARKMPSLGWCTNIISHVVKYRPEWVGRDRLRLVEISLSILRQEASYSADRRLSDIDDDALPTIRFIVFRLSHVLQEGLGNRCPGIAVDWLSSADGDPLPEVRLKRFAFDA